MSEVRVTKGVNRPHLVDVPLTDEEFMVLSGLVSFTGMSRDGVIRQAIRVYQALVKGRKTLKDGKDGKE